MQTSEIKLKTGEVLRGTIWSFRPQEGWLTISQPENDVKIFFDDIESGTTFNDRIEKGKIGNVDILELAKKYGWRPKE